MGIPRGVATRWLALLLMAGSLAAEARPDVVVTSLDFVSAMNAPAPFLLAITVE